MPQSELEAKEYQKPEISAEGRAFLEARARRKRARGEAPPPPEEEPARSMALDLSAWWQGNGGELLRSEEAVFHPEHRYAGRVDLVPGWGGGSWWWT